MTIAIAGAGIAGLTLGITLHQLGVPFVILERVAQLRPLGVGINLQPTAVRELTEMDLAPMLDEVGVQTRDYGFYTRTGREIWTEPRGLAAGYLWPQYSVHRGRLQMALFDHLRAHEGEDVVRTRWAVQGYTQDADAVDIHCTTPDGPQTLHAELLIAADGIHSAVRAQMYPDEGAPVWDGAIMWRGTSQAKPFLSGASMILAGHDHQRIVAYPITRPDPVTGLATLNWIAEKTVDPTSDVAREDWNREVDIDRFVGDFESWRFDWLDVPALIRGAERVYEYPMVDRDPVDRWTEGRVTLIGDAAHPTYPVGSNGASQAILDARILAAAIRAQAPCHAALMAYEEQVRPVANAVTLANRGQGPDAIMQMAEDRCAGDFSQLDAVLPLQERAAHAARYKALAGTSIEAINGRASILA